MSLGAFSPLQSFGSLRRIGLSSSYVWQPSDPVLFVCGVFFLITNSVLFLVKVLYKLCFLFQFSGAVCFQKLVHFLQVVEFFGICNWLQYSLLLFCVSVVSVESSFSFVILFMWVFCLCFLVSLVRGLSLQSFKEPALHFSDCFLVCLFSLVLVSSFLLLILGFVYSSSNSFKWQVGLFEIFLALFSFFLRKTCIAMNFSLRTAFAASRTFCMVIVSQSIDYFHSRFSLNFLFDFIVDPSFF